MTPLDNTEGIDTSTVPPTLRLGRTEMDITSVGFGAWAIGGADWAVGWGAQDDRQSVAAIRRALDSGVNWIDTAPVYGLGHSEDLVREALRPIPADGWFDAATLQLTDDDLQDIGRVIEATQAGSGPSLPMRTLRQGGASGYACEASGMSA